MAWLSVCLCGLPAMSTDADNKGGAVLRMLRAWLGLGAATSSSLAAYTSALNLTGDAMTAAQVAQLPLRRKLLGEQASR